MFRASGESRGSRRRRRIPNQRFRELPLPHLPSMPSAEKRKVTASVCRSIGGSLREIAVARAIARVRSGAGVSRHRSLAFTRFDLPRRLDVAQREFSSRAASVALFYERAASSSFEDSRAASARRARKARRCGSGVRISRSFPPHPLPTLRPSKGIPLRIYDFASWYFHASSDRRVLIAASDGKRRSGNAARSLAPARYRRARLLLGRSEIVSASRHFCGRASRCARAADAVHGRDDIGRYLIICSAVEIGSKMMIRLANRARTVQSNVTNDENPLGSAD